MKKLLIICIGLILTGCNYYYQEGIATISRPEKSSYKLDGSWALVDLRDLAGKSLDNLGQYSDRAYFKGRLVYMEDLYSGDLDYSMKNVDARDYLLYKYRYAPVDMDRTRLNIYNLKSQGTYLRELIELGPDRLAYFKDGKFLIYQREKEFVNQEEINNYLAKKIDRKKEIHRLEDRGNIGFLLGLKKSQGQGHTYRTLYIKIKNEKDIVDYQAQDILLPRKNGFYKISLEEKNQETLLSLDYLDQPGELIRLAKPGKKEILYVGNDFLSLETWQDEASKSLELYPIDYLEEGRQASLGDILDEASYQAVDQDLGEKQPKELYRSYNPRSFALRRTQGHWNLFGRALDQDQTYKDFKIRALAPKNLVKYDDLPILWTSIQAQLGQVEDAFISPKGDYIVTRLGGNLNIYPIYGNKIGSTSLYTIELDQDEEIVMGEWATNIYSQLWAEYFKGD